MKDNEQLTEVIKRAKQGDQNAFTTLLNKYWKEVYRFQFSKSNNEDEAEDYICVRCGNGGSVRYLCVSCKNASN